MGCGTSNTNNDKKHSHHKEHKDNSQFGKINETLLDEFITDDRMDILSNMKKLKHLYDICQKEINVELQNLTFADSSFFEFINLIGKNNNIQKLMLRNIEFEGKTEFMAHLANKLSGKETLKHIKFVSIINSGKKLAKAIAKILEDCPNIGRVSLIELDFDDEDCEYIGCILENNYKNFKVLKVSGIFLKENLQNFFDALKINHTLEELTLQKMNLRENNISWLLKGLKNNRHLKVLDISNNPIGNAVSFFEEDDEYFNSLETLKLNNCDITDSNINILLKSLSLNKSIKTLELNNNYITNESKENLIAFFNLNDTISTIYLLKNKIYKRAVSSALKNKDLVKLVLEI